MTTISTAFLFNTLSQPCCCVAEWLAVGVTFHPALFILPLDPLFPCQPSVARKRIVSATTCWRRTGRGSSRTRPGAADPAPPPLMDIFSNAPMASLLPLSISLSNLPRPPSLRCPPTCIQCERQPRLCVPPLSPRRLSPVRLPLHRPPDLVGFRDR